MTSKETLTFLELTFGLSESYNAIIEPIKRDLNRLDKLERAIEILKQYSSIEFLDHRRYGESDYFPLAIKNKKCPAFDYTVINLRCRENYELLKEVFENDKF